MSDEEIRDIARQFQRLQLQQAALIDRLEQLQTTRARPDTATRAPRPSPPTGATATTQRFAIGDKVRILNPNRLQFTSGKITKIGSNRITVQGPNNKTVWRAPKNLAIIEDE
jgi:hypothetical protein